MKRGAIIGIALATAMAFCSCSGGKSAERQIKQEIVVACGDDYTGTIENIMNDFTGQSETTQVKLIEFSNESVELHRAVSSMLAGKEVQLDAMLIEDVWVGEFIKNGYLRPLEDMVEFNSEEYLADIADFAEKDGRLYWYPMVLDTGIMYYREDISDGSLDYRQLSEQSEIKYSVQGVDGEEMLCCALELINLTGSVKDGLALYKKTINGAATSGDNYVTGFKNGESAYVRAWASDHKSITGYSPVATKINTKVLKDENGDSYATVRAYGISMNAASDKSENVKELLSYLEAVDAQTTFLRDMLTIPLKKKDYENPAITYYTNYTEEILPVLDELKFRPYRDDYTYLSRQARGKLSDYIIGEGSLDDAADAVEALLDMP